MSKTEQLIQRWRSLGPIRWAQSEFGWIDIDGQPITLSPWQTAILAAWEEHKAEVSTIGISNIKKTGKTFANSVLLAWRWLSLPGEHYCVGNDLDQSTSRQFQQISEMIRRNSYLKGRVKAGAKRLEFLPTGSTVVALATDAAGNAGSNHVSCSHTESWGIIYEAGVRAYEELTPPPGRFYGLPCLRICDSYSGYEGESETWHRLVDRGLAGEPVSEDWPIFRACGLLLFHAAGPEAQQRCFRGTPEEAELYYSEQREALRPSAFQRLHENQRSTGSEAFISIGRVGCLC